MASPDPADRGRRRRGCPRRCIPPGIDTRIDQPLDRVSIHATRLGGAPRVFAFGGGTQRLLRLVGRQRALQHLSTGDAMMIAAKAQAQAQALRVVDTVVPDEEVETTALGKRAPVFEER